MGLASMFLGEQNPFAQWVGQHNNMLGTIGSGLMQGQNLQHGLQIAGGTLPQANQLDLQQAEKAKADALKTSQANYTLKLFKDKGFTDLVDLATAGAPMSELMQEYFKRIQPKAPAAPLKGNAGDVFLDPVTYQPLATIPKPPEPMYRDLTDAEEIQKGLDPKFVWQAGPDGKYVQAGGGGVNVTTTLPASETAYDKAMGESIAKMRAQLLTDANSAPARLGTLSLMEQALNQPGFYSGAGADIVGPLKSFATGLGITDPSGISSMETFSAAAKQMTLDKMGGSLGVGVSNADVGFLTSTVPNLSATPQGNKVLIEVQRRLANRQIELNRLAEKYANEHGGRIDEGFSSVATEYADRNPLFKDLFVPGDALTMKQPEGTYQPGQVITDPNDPSKQWRFKGGNWQDQANWELVNGGM